MEIPSTRRLIVACTRNRRDRRHVTNAAPALRSFVQITTAAVKALRRRDAPMEGFHNSQQKLSRKQTAYRDRWLSAIQVTPLFVGLSTDFIRSHCTGSGGGIADGGGMHDGHPRYKLVRGDCKDARSGTEGTQRAKYRNGSRTIMGAIPSNK